MFKTGKIVFVNGRKEVTWDKARYATHEQASEAIQSRRAPIVKTKLS